MNPNDTVLGPFTGADFANIINLLRRAQFNGLEEAQVAVVLASKLDAILKQAASPQE